jgi:polyisoprenoid-binding protein YceI
MQSVKEQQTGKQAEAGKSSQAGQIKWMADPAHSEITFKVKHLMITHVTGILSDYTIEAYSDGERFDNVRVVFKGKADSISTGNEQRDKHLKGPDFFDVEKNPEIKFQSTEVKKSGRGYKMSGDLLIRNVTNKVTLDITLMGMQKDPWGKTRAGFTVSGMLNRKDFNLSWNSTLEGGGVLVSDEVTILCEVQMVKQD